MKLLRKILGGISLTVAMFVFQACYGTDYYCPSMEYNFRVVDTKGTPIPNIKVSSQWQSNGDYVYDWCFQGVSDSAGLAHLWVEDCNGLDVKFRFSDDDSVYAVYDTIINRNTVPDTVAADSLAIPQSSDTIDIVLHRVN